MLILCQLDPLEQALNQIIIIFIPENVFENDTFRIIAKISSFSFVKIYLKMSAKSCPSYSGPYLFSCPDFLIKSP